MPGLGVLHGGSSVQPHVDVVGTYDRQMTNPSGMKRHYPPYDVPPNRPLAPDAPPRPGHGRVYVYRNPADPEVDMSYNGVWEDLYDTPDAEGRNAGVEHFRGTAQQALTWAYSRQAPEKFILEPSISDDYQPLPADVADAPW